MTLMFWLEENHLFLIVVVPNRTWPKTEFLRQPMLLRPGARKIPEPPGLLQFLGLHGWVGARSDGSVVIRCHDWRHVRFLVHPRLWAVGGNTKHNVSAKKCLVSKLILGRACASKLACGRYTHGHQLHHYVQCYRCWENSSLSAG